MWIWALLIILFWAVVPGLITGWMLRERGRRFLPGLILGLICGPLGILTTLAFIYVADRRRARGRRHLRGRAVRVFYDVPVVGSLHVSTVWALAGLATFFCLWMIGGIAYEFYRNGLMPAATSEAQDAGEEVPKANSLLPANSSAGRQAPETRLNAQAQGNASAQTRAALLGNFSAQPGQPAQGLARSENSSSAGVLTTPGVAGGAGVPVLPPQQETAAARQPTLPTVSNALEPPAPGSKAPPRTRADAIAQVTRELTAGGHSVHAALSGDVQTATLSLTGATLNRAAGNQLLGDPRLRGALKAAGVRIVVMVNGQESWTYIL